MNSGESSAQQNSLCNVSANKKDNFHNKKHILIDGKSLRVYQKLLLSNGNILIPVLHEHI
jgi:hypothetical protein